MPRPPPDRAADAETVALQAVAWLAADPDRLSRFMVLSGTDPDVLRDGLTDPGLLGGVVDYLLQDDGQLVAFADAIGMAPERIAGMRRLLPGGAVPVDPP